MRTKKFAVLIPVMLLFVVGFLFITASAEKVTLSKTETPLMLQFVGNTDASLPATRLPDFAAFPSTDNAGCTNYLMQDYQDTDVTMNTTKADQNVYSDASGSGETGLSLAPLFVKSASTGGHFVSASDSRFRWQTIDSLEIADVKTDIPAKYKTSAYKALLTWTVRIEGSATSAYAPWPILCSPFHGESDQGFPSGQIRTKLFMDNTGVGNEGILTMPRGDPKYINQPNDPTLTGSYIVSGDKLKDVSTVSVKWYNDTSMQIKSPEKMRSLIVTIMGTKKE